MPEADEIRESKNFHTEVGHSTEGFFLKGSNSYDWGMKNRLARIFSSGSGNTVMLAFDHGYFQGPTTGLERIDLSINPLIPHADTLMLTRGYCAARFLLPRRNPSFCELRGDPAF